MNSVRNGGAGWRDFLSIFRFARGRLILLAATSTVSGFLEAAVLVVVVQTTMLIMSGKDAVGRSVGPVELNLSIKWLFVIAFTLSALRFLLMVFTAWVTARIGATVLSKLRRDAFASFLGASWGLQSKEKEGRLQDLMSTHGHKVAKANIVLANAVSSCAVVLTLLVAAFLVHAAATVMIMVSMVAIFYVLRPLSGISRRYSALESEANLEYSGAVSEAVRMALEIKTHDVGAAVRLRMEMLIERVASPYFRTHFIGGVLPAAYQNTSILLILGGLVVLYLTGVSNLTALGAVVLILLRALRRTEMLQQAYHSVHDLLPFVEKLQQTCAEYDRHAVSRDGLALPRVERLAFDDVWFSYTPGVPILHGFSFEIERGEAIGIVGPSGSGKSTLVQLLLRLREPDAGMYLVNGQDASSYGLADWYERMTFLPQEPRLVAGTVADNIRFFRELDDAAVLRAARLAHVHDEIMAFPDGYATDVGERGGGAVSGGQRQRICLARALATNPDVIILDEPTSALDLRSEALVQQTLNDLKGEVTILIIAHRLSTLNMCDRMMVLGEGRLEGFSTRGALLESNDFYREAVALSQLI